MTDVTIEDVSGWGTDLEVLTGGLGWLFARPGPREAFTDMVRGLLADVPRKNSWQLAEHAGHRNAYALEWFGFARESRRQMSLSSGASEISSLSMFVSFGAAVRGGWPRLSPKKIRLHKVTSCGCLRAHGRAARRLRSHRTIEWDQAMIGYFHVRRTVRHA